MEDGERFLQAGWSVLFLLEKVVVVVVFGTGHETEAIVKGIKFFS